MLRNPGLAGAYGAHLVMIFPRRLAGREQVGREVVRESAERFEDDELRDDDGERDDPDDDDHRASSMRLGLEVERVADGVVAFD